MGEQIIIPVFMVDTGEIKKYGAAINDAKKTLVDSDPLVIAKNSGTVFDTKDGIYRFLSFGRELSVDAKTGEIRFSETEALPLITWQIVALHYLVQAGDTGVTGDIVPFRNLPGGLAYAEIFKARSADQLARYIDKNQISLEDLNLAFENLGAKPADLPGDMAVCLPVFEKMPIYFSVWFGDAELPSTVNIYYDRSASSILPTEDIVVIGETAVRFVRGILEDQGRAQSAEDRDQNR